MSSIRSSLGSSSRQAHEFKKLLAFIFIAGSCLYRIQDQACSKDLALLIEDVKLTLDSLNAKDSVQALKKQTVSLANEIYLARLYGISRLIAHSLLESTQLDKDSKKEALATIYNLMSEVRSPVRGQGQASFYSHEGFSNPFPGHLLFSQKFHGPQFSNKSGRAYVQGKSIQDMAEQLRNQTLSPDDLRIQVYLARYEGKNYTFAYNNRTWTVFSRAQVPASRIVPILPTQDLIKRIYALIIEGHNPNTIYEETKNEASASIEHKNEMRGLQMTRSQKPQLELGAEQKETEENSPQPSPSSCRM